MLDAHLHVVDPDRVVADITGNPSGSWWEEVDARPGAVVDRLAAAGVAGGVFVQAVGAHGLADCSVALEAAADHDGFAATVTVDPRGDLVIPDGAAGIRLFSIRHQWLSEPVAGDVLAECEARRLVPAICCLADELDAVGPLLDSAGIEVALDHAGFVAVGGDDGLLVDLARRDNLIVKLSTGVFDHSALDPADTVDRLVDLVGADRIAWGSDHPQVHDRSYAELVALAGQATAHLPDAQREAILAGTTARLWLPPP